MSNVIVAMDIGSDKIATMIARIHADGRINILGDGLVQCKAIKKFTFADEDVIVKAIKQSVAQAQEKAGVIIHSVYVNIQGVYLSYIKNDASIEFDDDNIDNQVNKEDVYELIKRVSDIDVYADEKIVDIVPLKYIIDDTEVNDPIGLHGNKVSIEAEIVVGHNDVVTRICQFIHKAGYEVDGVIPESMATKEFLLTYAEKKETVLIVDVGGTLTEFTICKNDNVVLNSTIPIGGDYITSDVAKVFSITVSEAENLKRELKVAHRSLIEEDTDVSVYQLNKGDTEIVKTSLIVEVMEARIYEIFEKIKEKIVEAGIEDMSKISIAIITGQGLVTLKGYDIIAKEVLNIKSRSSQFFVETGYSPVFTLCYSMIYYIYSCIDIGRNLSMVTKSVPKDTVVVRKKRKPKFVEKVAKFISEFFSLNNFE